MGRGVSCQIKAVYNELLPQLPSGRHYRNPFAHTTQQRKSFDPTAIAQLNFQSLLGICWIALYLYNQSITYKTQREMNVYNERTGKSSHLRTVYIMTVVAYKLFYTQQIVAGPNRRHFSWKSFTGTTVCTSYVLCTVSLRSCIVLKLKIPYLFAYSCLINGLGQSGRQRDTVFCYVKRMRDLSCSAGLC